MSLKSLPLQTSSTLDPVELYDRAGGAVPAESPHLFEFRDLAGEHALIEGAPLEITFAHIALGGKLGGIEVAAIVEAV